ncbi:MAG: AAA family ATPase [Butyrivibrio sp.]|nr:AAA family ATPase [Butyrivibrio sp.]
MSKSESGCSNEKRKPLILTGVRQCGKTYIVVEFANYKSY